MENKLVRGVMLVGILGVGFMAGALVRQQFNSSVPIDACAKPDAEHAFTVQIPQAIPKVGVVMFSQIYAFAKGHSETLCQFDPNVGWKVNVPEKASENAPDSMINPSATSSQATSVQK